MERRSVYGRRIVVFFPRNFCCLFSYNADYANRTVALWRFFGSDLRRAIIVGGGCVIVRIYKVHQSVFFTFRQFVHFQRKGNRAGYTSAVGRAYCFCYPVGGVSGSLHSQGPRSRSIHVNYENVTFGEAGSAKGYLLARAGANVRCFRSRRSVRVIRVRVSYTNLHRLGYVNGRVICGLFCTIYVAVWLSFHVLGVAVRRSALVVSCVEGANDNAFRWFVRIR